MRRVVGVVGSFAFFAAIFAGVNLLFDYTLGRPLQPVWGYWISGMFFGVVMVSIREGWLRGVFNDPRLAKESRDRKAQLAEDRERILRVQRVKPRLADGRTKVI